MIIPQEECIKDIHIYQHSKKTKNGGTLIKSIWGIPSKTKEGYIHETENDYATFSDKPIKIPKGYIKLKRTKKRYSDDWARTYLCKKRKTKKQENAIKKKLDGALEYNDWYDRSRKYWLTIGDVLKMKHGDAQEFLMLDRNATDVAFSINKENRGYQATKFFRDNKIKYIHLDGVSGNLTQKYKMTDFKTKKTTIQTDNYDTVFHVEFRKHNWYPFFDGYLPAKDHQNAFKLLGKKIHYTKFPKNTALGFRGPLIRWSDVSKLPKVYYNFD